MTKAESELMHESVKLTVKTNERKIIDAAPPNFMVFVNISAISTPVQTDSPLTPTTLGSSTFSNKYSTTFSTSILIKTTTSLSAESQKYSRNFEIIFFMVIYTINKSSRHHIFPVVSRYFIFCAYFEAHKVFMYFYSKNKI